MEHAVQRDLFRSEQPSSKSPEIFVYDSARQVIIRVLTHRDGTTTSSEVKASPELVAESADLASTFDLAWLRAEHIPQLVEAREQIRIADLFSGCGGMTFGLQEACRALGLSAEPVFANDIDETALAVYKDNFPSANLLSEPIETVLDSAWGADPSPRERELLDDLGEIDVLLGGPPCQGHSNLNNHTRRSDHRNALFLRMARFAELFEPDYIIIENVTGVRHDRLRVFDRTWRKLEDLGYFVDGDIIRAEEIGVAQRRPRVFMLASRMRRVSIRELLDEFRRPFRTFAWACEDLQDICSDSPLDQIPRAIPVTQARIDYLFKHDRYELPDSERPDCHRTREHTYQSVYGRIHSDRPSPTITTGFMTMGRGRFVHPHRPRTLTAHEGARIQFFPDRFDFGRRHREAYLRLIGNAVPPKMAYVAGVYLLR